MISPLPGVDRRSSRAARRSRSPASAPTSSTTTATPVGDPGRRLPRAHAAVAVDAARHLGRPRALPRDVLEPVPRSVLRRRRRQARRRGLLLAARPGRRRHARRRATTSPPPRSSHALVGHPAVAEAAVVGRTDDTTGQAIAAFVILRGGNEPTDALVAELRDHVGQHIGPIAKPKTILFTEDLPEDPLGQDHAPPAAQRGRGPGARRHHDARRSRRRRGHQGALPRQAGTDED